MNRSLSLHPLSLVLGVVFGVLVLVSMSQVPPLNARNVVVQYGPDPRNYVQIQGVTPYTVPPGKLFVLTAIGTAQVYQSSPTVGCSMHLNVNGSPEVVGGTGGIGSVPVGLTVQAGSIITLTSDGGTFCSGYDQTMRAWGYLAPQ